MILTGDAKPGDSCSVKGCEAGPEKVAITMEIRGVGQFPLCRGHWRPFIGSLESVGYRLAD